MPIACTRLEAAPKRLFHNLFVASVALACAACSSQPDDRPMTIEYITEAILAPTCGQADCHSTFAANRTDIFDTVEGARRSLVLNGLIQFTSSQYDPANPQFANLIIWVTETDPFGLGFGRMPLDEPLPNEDILFLESWIASPSAAVGAQCDPSQPTACDDHDVVTCNADWSFGPVVQTCTGTCALGGSGGECQ